MKNIVFFLSVFFVSAGFFLSVSNVSFAANVGDACVGSTSGKSGNCIASPYPAQVCLSTNVEDARNNNEACGGNRCYQEVMKYSQVCSE